MSSILYIETIRAALIAAELDERRKLLLDLYKIKDPDFATLIAEYLRDPSPAVSEAAVEALARCENSIAADAAAFHLRSSNPAVRGYALETLIRLGIHALPRLTQLLGDPDQNIRKFAADAMGSIHADESLPSLLKALRSSDVLVAAAAAEALGSLGNPETVPVLGAAVERGPDWLRISALAGLGKIGGNEALSYICRVPTDSAAYVQAAAVSAISSAVEHGSTEAYTFLAKLLSPEKPALAEEIVKTLGHWIAYEKQSSTSNWTPLTHLLPAFQPYFVGGLISQDPLVRAAAVTCYDRVDDFDLSKIILLMADEEIGVRLAALNTLVSHSALSIEDIAHIALNEHEEEVIRITALHYLTTLIQRKIPCDHLILESLIRLVNTANNPPLQVAAIRALLVSGDAAGNACVISQFTEEEFANEDAVLAELMDCPVDLLLPIALKGLEDADPDVRWRIFTTLVRPERASEFTGSLDGQALIIAALGDEDWRMRVHAVSILGKCADQAWACKLLRNACESLDDRVRIRAVDALGSCQGSLDEIKVLKAHLSDTNERVRTAAFRALVRLGPLEEEELRQALLDPYPPMQQAALVALLSSDQYLKSQPLWTLAEQITVQSFDPEITELRTDVRQRLIRC